MKGDAGVLLEGCGMAMELKRKDGRAGAGTAGCTGANNVDDDAAGCEKVKAEVGGMVNMAF